MEAEECRICRAGGEPGDPLFYPCACSGSIKFVHQGCLLQWLHHSRARHCEVCSRTANSSPLLPPSLRSSSITSQPRRLCRPQVCKHAFAFSPVYAAGAPARLPLVELLWGLGARAGWALRLAARLALVLAVWLLAVPLATCALCRLAFARTLPHAHALLHSRATPPLLLADCIYGSALSAGIVLVFLAATSLREYLRHLRDDAAAAGADGGPANGLDRLWLPLQQHRDLEIPPPWLRAGGGRGPGPVVLPLPPADGLAVLPPPLPEDAAEEAEVEGGDELPFDELVGMQGPILHLLENAITVLASNAIFLMLVVLLPFTLGRLVLSTASRLMSSSYLPEASGFLPSAAVDMSDGALVGVGYSVVGVALLVYCVLLALLRSVRGRVAGEPVAVDRVGLGVAWAARQAGAVARQSAVALKVAALLGVELGLFPLLCGWWLDMCTLRLVGATAAQRLQGLARAPLAASLVHWGAGILYMLHITLFVALLREILRPGILAFLRDPTDPAYNPLRDLVEDPLGKHCRRVLLSTLVYGNLIVMLIYLPAQAALALAPRVFPLNFRFSDPFTEIPADMLLFHVCVPFTIEHFRPRATLKRALRMWFSALAPIFSLATFLLPPPAPTNPQQQAPQPNAAPVPDPALGPGLAVAPGPQAAPQPPMQAHAYGEAARERNGVVPDLAPAMALDKGNTSNDGVDKAEDAWLAGRLAMLLGAAWATLLACNTGILLLPTATGRWALYHLTRVPYAPHTHCNDLYAWGLGCYLLWGACAVVRHAAAYACTHRARTVAWAALHWAGLCTQGTLLLVLWLGAVPILAGVLFELLLLVPLRVPPDQTPVLLLYQDWALGLLFLKIWVRLVSLTDAGWRERLERARAHGLVGLKAGWCLREVVGPVLVQLLTALCCPYVVARWLASWEVLPAVWRWAIMRYAWLATAGLTSLGLLVAHLSLALMRVHDAIRDDRYLVGRRLHNFARSAVEGREAGVTPAEQLKEGDDSSPGELVSEQHQILQPLENANCHLERLSPSSSSETPISSSSAGQTVLDVRLLQPPDTQEILESLAPR
eukprot:SM000140S00627  [mRNA]  locus=s140:187485:191304:- [translate_table: standard]